MKLSAPIFQLKRRAKALARELDEPLFAALDRVAAGASLQDLSTHLPEADLETALASLISRGWLLSIVNSPHIVDTEEPA